MTAAEEAAGVCTDKTGNGHDATLGGSAEFYNFAARGKVLHFPINANSSASVNGTFNLNITQGLSVGAWIYREDDSPGVVINREGSFRLWFPDASGKPCFSVYSGGTWWDAISSDPLPTQQWVFIQGALGPIDTKIFVHGSVKGICHPSGLWNDNSTTILIGRRTLFYNMQFAGYIGEIMIRDAVVDLSAHRVDLKRWIKRNQGEVVELLELHLPTEVLRFCSRPTFISLQVRPV